MIENIELYVCLELMAPFFITRYYFMVVLKPEDDVDFPFVRKLSILITWVLFVIQLGITFGVRIVTLRYVT